MIRNALYRFMHGRYGSDQLNHFITAVALLFLIVHTFTRFQILYWIWVVLFFWLLFRTLSRNAAARRQENAQFLKLVKPILAWLRLRRTMHRDKEHRYFKCPSCAQRMRVPKGKGRITVNCRNCGASFEEKS